MKIIILNIFCDADKYKNSKLVKFKKNIKKAIRK
jgi:hypothetical protein